MMRQFLIDLLKQMEAAVPPPVNCHHALTFAQHGSDDLGWRDELALQLNIDGKFQCFFIEPEDEEKSTEQLVAEIASIAKYAPRNVQFGVGLGQYTKGPRRIPDSFINGLAVVVGVPLIGWLLWILIHERR